jgi:hypothetical protein
MIMFKAQLFPVRRRVLAMSGGYRIDHLTIEKLLSKRKSAASNLGQLRPALLGLGSAHPAVLRTSSASGR